MDGFFIQVELEEGVPKEEITRMIEEISADTVIFKEAHQNNTSCYGFLSADIDVGDEEKIMDEVAAIINDLELENPSRMYNISNHIIKIDYCKL